MLNVERSFDYVKINLASPSRIREWGKRVLPNGQSVGEITKPETINYRTLKPEMHGLFCERIFGPVNDWECHCGKYKRVNHKGIVCERCGVEVIDSKVRRHRLGFIELASPVTHVWYVKGRPSKIALVLGISLKELEQIVYFNSYVVVNPGEGGFFSQNELLSDTVWTALEYHNEMIENVEISIGASAIKKLLARIDLQKEVEILREALASTKRQSIKERLIKRIRVLDQFLASKFSPS